MLNLHIVFFTELNICCSLSACGYESLASAFSNLLSCALAYPPNDCTARFDRKSVLLFMSPSPILLR